MSPRVTNSKPRIVVLGGGNGTSRLLTALAPLLHEGRLASLHALVLNADDGGSTGRLRNQYGVAAMGDLTKCLVALSNFHRDIRGQQFLRALDYRFNSGDFKGHTLRNIFLTSLEKTSDIDAAIAMMARLLQVPKAAGVLPITLQPLTQQVMIEFDGKKNVLGEGQHSISHHSNLQADPRWKPGDVRVMFAEGDVSLNPRAARILTRATHIIVAPGHTYGTILPLLALPDLSRELQKLPTQLIIVMTLLTTPRQTADWSGEDFVRVYESYLGRPADVVLANTGSVDVELVEDQAWVRFTEEEHAYHLLQADLVSTEKNQPQEGDVVPRAVIVHDPEKIRQYISQIVSGSPPG